MNKPKQEHWQNVVKQLKQLTDLQAKKDKLINDLIASIFNQIMIDQKNESGGMKNENNTITARGR